MAKPQGVPALTAQRVWEAIKRGSLKVEVIPGTRMLRVIKGRIRLSWQVGDLVKHARIRRTRIYLNPRWIPLPIGFDVSKILGLSREELARQGIIRLKNGDYRRLIYQQLDDPFSLLRQIEEHIMPRYGQEEEELWGLFSSVDLRATLGLSSAPEDLQEAILGRVDQIGVIKTHLSGRSKAVEERIRKLKRLQQHVRGALGMILDLIPEQTEGTEGYVIGLINSLQRHYDSLTLLLEDNPLVHSTRWARYHIQKARHNLERHEFNQARDHLQKAVSYLQWPEEREKG